MDLSERQSQLLLHIINEFIETAEAVGSLSLQNKYNFDISPATIRNEMAQLATLGYLFQKHNSGGRIPTTKGFRFYIDNLQEKKPGQIDLKTKDQIEKDLGQISVIGDYSLIKQAISSLANLTGNIAVAIIDGNFYHYGLSSLINIPEFQEKGNLKNILKLLEDYYELSKILNESQSGEDINVIIGDESDNPVFENYAVIFSEIRLEPGKKGYIAVLGPNRMNYTQIIPIIKYVTQTIKLLQNQK